MDINEFKEIKIFGDGYQPMDSRLDQLAHWSKTIPENKIVLEFGVFSGRTINWMAKTRPDLKFYGFDSFTGLPEEWDMGYKTISKDRFNTHGRMPPVRDNVTLIEGYFNTTLLPWLEKRKRTDIGLLHIDSDIYSSAIYILETLNDYIKPGCIIIFDELCDFRYKFHGLESTNEKSYRDEYSTWSDHEWKALNEWETKYNRKLEPLSRNWCYSAALKVGDK